MSENFQLPKSVKDGRYEIRDYLGKGAMALVYLGWDRHMRQEVAVKFLNNQVAEDVDNPDNPYMSFRREIDTLIELKSCENIVKILDYDLYHDPQYIIMDYMSGGTAEDLKSELLELPTHDRLLRVSQILDEIIVALECSHQKSIVHRDIKPSNIFFDDKTHAHLGDFGIAKNLLIDSGFSQTATILGPIKYMSPEAIEGDATEQSDQYSLACVIYELLTGQHVFSANSLLKLNDLILKQPHTPLNQTMQGREFSEAITKVIDRALSKKPQDRYPSVRKFGEAFQIAIRMSQLSELPTTILDGRYEILDPIGSGGMGVVHLAYDKHINKNVAVKFLSVPKDEEDKKDMYSRFQDEIDTLKKLNPYDYIVSIMDYGNEGDIWFVIMEYMEGGDLYDRMLDYLKMDLPERLRRVSQLVQEIALALEQSHKNNIIHRDIKLRNILFNRRGEAHLADFGIAKNVQRNTQITQAGMIVGTINYMAPEAISGNVTKFSDQYSLACVVYEILTGQRAFDGTTVVRLIQSISNKMPERLNRTPYGKQYPDSIADVLEKALSKHPEERYPDIREFAEAFDNAIGLETGTIRPKPIATPIPPNPFDSKTMPGTGTGNKKVSTNSNNNAVPSDPNRNRMIYGSVIVILAVIFIAAMIAASSDNNNNTVPIVESSAADTETATDAIMVMDTEAVTEIPSETDKPIATLTDTITATHSPTETAMVTDEPTETATEIVTATDSPTATATDTATNTPFTLCPLYKQVDLSLDDSNYTGIDCGLFHELDSKLSDVPPSAIDILDYLGDECDGTDDTIAFVTSITFARNISAWTELGDEICGEAP